MTTGKALHRAVLLVAFCVCVGTAAFHRQLHISGDAEVWLVVGAVITFLGVID